MVHFNLIVMIIIPVFCPETISLSFVILPMLIILLRKFKWFQSYYIKKDWILGYRHLRFKNSFTGLQFKLLVDLRQIFNSCKFFSLFLYGTIVDAWPKIALIRSLYIGLNLATMSPPIDVARIIWILAPIKIMGPVLVENCLWWASKRPYNGRRDCKVPSFFTTCYLFNLYTYFSVST